MIYLAAYLSVFMFIGHMTMGIKTYLKPMLQSDTETIAKQVMHAVFHYVTLAMLLSSIVLVSSAHKFMDVSMDTIRFIGIFYLSCGLYQMALALKYHGPKGLIKLFQWTMFLPISLLALLASM